MPLDNGSLLFEEWIETPEGREAYRLAQDRDISAALRAVWDAASEQSDRYYSDQIPSGL